MKKKREYWYNRGRETDAFWPRLEEKLLILLFIMMQKDVIFGRDEQWALPLML
jgi:hypothetical protein